MCLRPIFISVNRREAQMAIQCMNAPGDDSNSIIAQTSMDFSPIDVCVKRSELIQSRTAFEIASALCANSVYLYRHVTTAFCLTVYI